MTEWTYGFIGVILWVIFVHVIAPDLSYSRSLLASMVGVIAVMFLAIEASGIRKKKRQQNQKELPPN
jgi:hypothetical protein